MGLRKKLARWTLRSASVPSLLGTARCPLPCSCSSPRSPSVLLLVTLLAMILFVDSAVGLPGVANPQLFPAQHPRPATRHHGRRTSLLQLTSSDVARLVEEEDEDGRLHRRRSVVALELGQPFRLRTINQYELFLVRDPPNYGPYQLQAKRTQTGNRGAWFKLMSNSKGCPHLTERFRQNNTDSRVLCPYKLLVSNNMTDNNSYKNVCINKTGQLIVTKYPKKGESCEFIEEPSAHNFKYYSYGQEVRIQEKLKKKGKGRCREVPQMTMFGSAFNPHAGTKTKKRSKDRWCKWYLEVNKSGSLKKANKARGWGDGASFYKLKYEAPTEETFPEGTKDPGRTPGESGGDNRDKVKVTSKPSRHGHRDRQPRPSTHTIISPFSVITERRKTNRRRGSKNGRTGSRNSNGPLSGQSGGSLRSTKKRKTPSKLTAMLLNRKARLPAR